MVCLFSPLNPKSEQGLRDEDNGRPGDSSRGCRSPQSPEGQQSRLAAVRASEQVVRREVKLSSLGVCTSLWTPVPPALPSPLRFRGPSAGSTRWLESESLSGSSGSVFTDEDPEARRRVTACRSHTAPTPCGQLYASNQTGPWTMKTMEGTPGQTSCFPSEGPKSPTPRLLGPRPPTWASPGPHCLPHRGRAGSSRFCTG